MPKVVDPLERRAVIAEAVFDLIEKGGIGQASLRNVAAQAEINIGSVRHYVDGHEGMLIDATRVMAERVEGRIHAIWEAFDGTGRQDLAELAVDLLEQFLPLDRERRREVTVWLAFTEHSRTETRFADEARQLLNGPRELSRAMLQSAGTPEFALGAELLAATVDGLSLALLHDPQRLTPQQIRRLLFAQLGWCVSLGSHGD